MKIRQWVHDTGERIKYIWQIEIEANRIREGIDAGLDNVKFSLEEDIEKLKKEIEDKIDDLDHDLNKFVLEDDLGKAIDSAIEESDLASDVGKLEDKAKELDGNVIDIVNKLDMIEDYLTLIHSEWRERVKEARRKANR